ncbi:hypothetical protein [Streptomyces albogriseolus]|nr:hypothetical protein [Streptomyces viridodiastaticus]MCX4624385.1 hypothetical protein [Streptomyces viridodiastaticus]
MAGMGAQDQVLLNHREEILEDVPASLSKVGHPELLGYQKLV